MVNYRENGSILITATTSYFCGESLPRRLVVRTLRPRTEYVVRGEKPGIFRFANYEALLSPIDRACPLSRTKNPQQAPRALA